MVFLVLKTLWYVKEPDTIEGGQVALFMGPDYVITVRQGARFELESVRRDLEEHADVLKQGPAAVVHAVCDRVVDVYELVVSDLETDVDEVEASVFSPQRPPRLQADLRAQPGAHHAAPGCQPAAGPDAAVRPGGNQGCLRGYGPVLP